MAANESPGAPVGGAAGAGTPCHATAAGTPDIARETARRHYRAYHVEPDHGGPAFTVYLKGRTAWALDRLAEAGPRGCTPKDEPAPRWSSYVHILRGHGVPILTVRERHGGAFPGVHGRYRLAARVRRAGP